MRHRRHAVALPPADARVRCRPDEPTLPPMEWPSDLETVPEIDVETRPSDGVAHRTTVWAVVDGGDVYVRSLRGSAGRWYQELLAVPDTVIHVAGEVVPGHGVPAPG